jgi:hypothetical protein
MKSNTTATLFAAFAIVAMSTSCDKEEGMPLKGNTVPAISADDMATVAGARIFFGHQSVGQNIIDGISELAAGRGLPSLSIVETRDAPKGGNAVFAHAPVGKNGDPSGKIRNFAAIIRGGMGDAVEVAFMKFCYIDVGAGTDIDSLFAEYRTTMATIQREYPRVTFLHVSTPLETRRTDIKGIVKRLLGRNDNIARERLNTLFRKEYGGTTEFFDLASVESTATDGSRVSYKAGGKIYYALAPAYAADSGHLNAAGRAAIAESLLGILARVIRKLP